MAIAQTQTEQVSSPIITDLTSQCACQNSVNRDTSVEICGRSAGFIGDPLGFPGGYPRPRSAPGWRTLAEPKRACGEQVAERSAQDPKLRDKSSRPPPPARLRIHRQSCSN